MTRSLALPKYLLIYGIPAAMIISMVMLAKSSFFHGDPDQLSLAITIDLVITTPLIYFLLIRSSAIPKITVIPFIIAGVVLGTAILPPENQYHLDLFKTWVLPVMELAVLSFVIFKVRKVIQGYKLNKKGSIDFYDALKITCHDILPKAFVIPVISEISVFYYGFFHWKKRELKENEFSCHKESGSVVLLSALIFLVIIETFVFHLLLVQWSSIAAWILSIISIYSGFQVFGFMRSLSKRPISIENGKICLRYGIMADVEIELSDIEEIELSSADIELSESTRKLSPLGQLESHNTIIHLKREARLTGLYGIKKTFRILALHIDDNSKFKEKAEAELIL